MALAIRAAKLVVSSNPLACRRAARSSGPSSMTDLMLPSATSGQRPMTRQSASAKLLVLGLCAICGLAVVARFPRWIRGPDEAYVIVAEDAWAGRLGLANYDDEAMEARTGAMTEGRNRSFLAPTSAFDCRVAASAGMGPSGREAHRVAAAQCRRIVSDRLSARPHHLLANTPPLAGCRRATALLLSEPLAENLARGQVYLLLMPAAAGVLVATATGDRRGRRGLPFAPPQSCGEAPSGWRCWRQEPGDSSPQPRS